MELFAAAAAAVTTADAFIAHLRRTRTKEAGKKIQPNVSHER